LDIPLGKNEGKKSKKNASSRGRWGKLDRLQKEGLGAFTLWVGLEGEPEVKPSRETVVYPGIIRDLPTSTRYVEQCETIEKSKISTWAHLEAGGETVQII